MTAIFSLIGLRGDVLCTSRLYTDRTLDKP
jgi:hypothetical protein